MIGRMTMMAALLIGTPAMAQDVPGIEICTVDKTMERRTSCLQSNVDFLVKTINKLRADHDQKLDALSRQNAALGRAVVELQKVVAEMQAAKPSAVKSEPDTVPAKGATGVRDAPVKDTPAK